MSSPDSVGLLDWAALGTLTSSWRVALGSKVVSAPVGQLAREPVAHTGFLAHWPTGALTHLDSPSKSTGPSELYLMLAFSRWVSGVPCAIRYTTPPGPKPAIVRPAGTCTRSTNAPLRSIT